MTTLTERNNALNFYHDSKEFKRLATELFGPQCEEFEAGCICCNAHRLANLTLETSTSEVNELEKISVELDNGIDPIWSTPLGVSSSIREIDSFLSDEMSYLVDGVTKTHLQHWKAALNGAVSEILKK